MIIASRIVAFVAAITSGLILTGCPGDSPTGPDLSLQPAKVAFIAQPSAVTSGVAISPAIVVEVQNANGVKVNAATTVTLSLSGGTTGARLGGTLTASAVDGVATFTGVTIDRAASGYVLNATAPGLSTATTASFAVLPGAATRLAFKSAIGHTPAGSALPAFEVEVRDAAGNVVTTATSSIALALGANTFGGTLGGTATVAAVNGLASFNGVTVSRIGTGYTLTAARDGLTAATSNAFDVMPVEPLRLAFTPQPPATIVSGATAATINVSVVDANANVVSTSTASIALATATAPTGGAVTGTLTAAAVAGVAAFNDIKFGAAGSYTLRATSGTMTGTSSAVSVTAGAPAKLGFVVSPSNVVAGVSVAPAVKVAIQDAFGNTVTTSTAAVTVQSTTSYQSGTFTANAVNGIATFSDLKISAANPAFVMTVASTGLTSASSAPFAVAPAAASKLVFKTQPTAVLTGQPITPAPSVEVQDAFGNPITGSTAPIVMAIGTNPAAGVLSGTLTKAAVAGVATFSDLALSAGGTAYTLRATSGALTAATSSAFNVSFAPAAKLGFTVQPSTVTAGVTLTPAVKVAVRDAAGNTITTSTAPVTVQSTGDYQSGTFTVNAVSGIATFSTLKISAANPAFVMTVASTGLTSASSPPFIVNAAAASKLGFKVQPASAIIARAMSPAPIVEVQDAFGNLVSSSTASITVAIGTNPGTGTLTGTLTKAAVAGAAPYSNLVLSALGTGYTLRATSGTLAAATTAPFNVTIVPVGTVTATPASKTLYIGPTVFQTVQLVATVKDIDNATLTDRVVTWASSAPTVATVSGTGLVTAVAPGTANITATSETVNSALVAITVQLVPVTNVAVAPTTASLITGATQQLTATLTDSASETLSLTGRTVTWTSGMPGVATVSASGLVTAVAPGTATITATSEGRSATATITVTLAPVATVTVSPSSGSVAPGGTVTFSAVTKDALGNTVTGRTVTWSSSAPAAATVNASTGVVTGVASGSATITATSETKTGTATVFVENPIASVAVTPATANIYDTQTQQLTATPKDASGASLAARPAAWSSSATSIATVSASGLVTANAPGTATITATIGGQSGTSVITVAALPAAPSGLNITKGTAAVGNPVLHWTDNSTTETGFEVQRAVGTAVFGAFSLLTTTAANATGYDDVSVVGNTKYKYRVRACNPGGCSAYQPSVADVIWRTFPAAPSNMTATLPTSGGTTINLTWTNNSIYAATSIVPEVANGLTSTSFSPIPIFPNTGSATSATYSGSSNSDYRFRVKACNESGCSAYSNIDPSGTPPSDATFLTAATGASTGQIGITWNYASSGTATYFKLYRGSTILISSSISGSTRSYTDTGLTSGSSQSYMLQACKTTDGREVCSFGTFSNFTTAK